MRLFISKKIKEMMNMNSKEILSIIREEEIGMNIIREEEIGMNIIRELEIRMNIIKEKETILI